MNGCGDTWSTERNTESKILKPHLFLLCLWEWERERCLSLCRCFLSLSRSRSPPSSLEREEWWRLERWEDELPPSLGKTILWRRQIVRVQITFYHSPGCLYISTFQHCCITAGFVYHYTLVCMYCNAKNSFIWCTVLWETTPQHTTSFTMGTHSKSLYSAKTIRANLAWDLDKYLLWDRFLSTLDKTNF